MIYCNILTTSNLKVAIRRKGHYKKFLMVNKNLGVCMDSTVAQTSTLDYLPTGVKIEANKRSTCIAVSNEIKPSHQA